MFSTPVTTIPEIPLFPRNNYDNMEWKSITYEDIEKALRKLKGTASPGPDGIFGLCYKNGGIFIRQALLDIYNHMINDEYASDRTTECWISPT